MTDITELAQSLKAAAEKLGAAQWQTRNGFSGTEVIVKGSLEKGAGCVSFQPVAADIADTKTARAIALFSPANILALVEALEKAQQRIGKLEKKITDHKRMNQEMAKAMLTPNDSDAAGMEIAALRQRIAGLESRTVTVKLPDIMPPEAAPAHYWGSGESMAYADGYNKSAADLKTSFALSCSSAGVNVEFE